jgi:hypothetical protein
LPRTIAVDDFYAFNLYQAKEVKKLMHHPLIRAGHVNVHRWRRMHEHLKKSGMVKGSFDPEALIFDPVRQHREREQRLFFATLIVLSIVVVVLGAAFAWTVTLKRTVARRTEDLRDSEIRFRDFAEGGWSAPIEWSTMNVSA